MPSVTPLEIPWNRAAICLDHRCPSPPGITPGLKDHLRCLLGNLCRASHRWEFPGIGSPSAWNTAAHSSRYNTRNQDRLRRRPPWNLLELDDSPPGSTSLHLPGITPGPQDSTFLTPSSGSHIYTIRYTVCVCVSLKTILHPPLLCFSFSENNSYRLVLC